MPKTLPREFYLQDTKKVAENLLGKILCHRKNGKTHRYIISETEAYLGIEDPAAHSYRGLRTARTEPLYAKGGHVYVYFIYGIYHCLNVVTRQAGSPEAVLIRSLKAMNEDPKNKKATNGPGKLCRVLGIDRSFNGIDLTKKKKLWIEMPSSEAKFRFKKTSRIGIDYAGKAAQWPLRYIIHEN